jgi:hypothetical protein
MRVLVPFRQAAAIFGCLWLGGCALVPPGIAPAAAPAISPAETPVAAFARDAVPGQRALVEVAPGRRVPVTFQRAYTAGSGAECRLLRIEDVPGGRGELVCRDPDRGWAQARPLLRGGAVAVR